MFRHACRLGLEGIGSKKLAAPTYLAGARAGGRSRSRRLSGGSYHSHLPSTWLGVMRRVQPAQIGWVIWRVIALGLCAAVLLLLTSGAFADESASRKIAALSVAPELQGTALARPARMR